MNNWLALTPEQINAIKSQVSSFIEEEVQFNGSVTICPEPDNQQSVEIEWLEIKVLDKFFTLIDEEKPLKHAVIQLTDEQYEEAKEYLKGRYYD